MSDTIKISVDGQDGDLVARTSGIRFVTPDNDLALVRVSYLEIKSPHIISSAVSMSRIFPFIVALLPVLVPCLPR